MKIDVQKLQTGPTTIELDHRPAYFGSKGDDYELTENVTGELVFTRLNERIVMDGVLKTAIRTRCARCLKDVDIPVEKDITVIYARERPEDPESLDPTDPEEVSHYKGTRIEPDRDIRELILVELPDYPHCREECRGLCPYCGRDLNKGKCNCRDEWKPRAAGENGWKKSLKRIMKETKSK